MRTLAVLLLAASAHATDWGTIFFKLPDPGGRMHTIPDFEARYLLLVYQGIP